jgi:hypothetical protein
VRTWLLATAGCWRLQAKAQLVGHRAVRKLVKVKREIIRMNQPGHPAPRQGARRRWTRTRRSSAGWTRGTTTPAGRW